MTPYLRAMLDLAPHRAALAAFARRWQVARIALFGSALRDDFGPASDIDLLIDFEPGTRRSLFDVVEMKRELEALFGRSVDIATRSAVERSPNWIRRREILSTARAVYAAH